MRESLSKASYAEVTYNNSHNSRLSDVSLSYCIPTRNSFSVLEREDTNELYNYFQSEEFLALQEGMEHENENFIRKHTSPSKVTNLTNKNSYPRGRKQAEVELKDFSGEVSAVQSKKQVLVVSDSHGRYLKVNWGKTIQ